MTSATKIDLTTFELVPVTGDKFKQQLATKAKSAPIETTTFKALLLAAAKSVQYANAYGSELAIARSKQNYDFYFDQIDMESGDALAMFMYSVDDWSL